MQITIHDHDTSTSSRRDAYRWNIVFSVGNEHEFGITRNLCANFADFAAWLVASGQVDGYDDSDDDGEIWVNIDEQYSDDWGGGLIRRSYSYTFDQYIKEHILTKGGDRLLVEYVATQVSFAADSVVEDVAMI